MQFGKSVLLSGTATSLLVAVPCAMAQSGERQVYDLPAQPLGEALRAVARKSDRQLAADPEALEGLQAAALTGEYTAEEAVRALLRKSGLRVVFSGRTIIVRGRSAPPRDEIVRAADDSDIVVTGSRLRGTPAMSPVVTIGQDDIRNAGQADLGEAIRSLPQSFGGGQNPGVAIGSFGAGTTNLNSASSLNLRGLGSDASLTLLNGRRLAYGGANQAVDISAIPVDAVEKIEIVTDGASAIYGSDAVGGVANVILKRDYKGAAISARIGGAIQGGDFEQKYSAVAGTRWSSGGVIATYDFSRNTAISAHQRDYTRNLDATSTLYPFQKAHAVLVSGYQALGEDVEVSLDALYNDRRHRVLAPFSTTAPYSFYGSEAKARTKMFTIAPSIKANAIAGWTIALDAVRGESRARYSTLVASGGANLYDTHGCYCSTLTSIELHGDGALFEMPAGSVRVALGAGYRRNELDYSRERTNFRPVTTPGQYFHGKQESVYGFGEVFIPIVSPAQDLSYLRRVNVTAALRYEDYRGMGSVATPKLGLMIAPTDDFDLKGSWGKSFKAPTLYQQYLSQDTYLYNVTGYGVGYPAGSTVLYRAGGNSALEPERARNLTATLSLHPVSIEGLQLELSAFHIRYSQRVTEPIISAAGILSNPAYASLVTLAPSQAAIDEAINAAAFGLTNYSSGAYNPANIVAIIDNRFTNVTRQTIKGLDISAAYRWQLGDGSLRVTGAASYLESRQKLVATQPSSQQAGTIFNPPHLRIRASAVWNHDVLTMAAYVSHIGKVTDIRQSPVQSVEGQTPIDLSVTYRFDPAAGVLGNVEMTLSVQNVLNDEPSIIKTQSAHFTPYDSTNYSGIGRFASITLTKRW